MADINLISSPNGKKNGKNGAAPAPKGDDMAMHVPAPEPERPVEKPAGFLPAVPKPPPPPPAPDSILKQKIQPIPTTPAPPRPPPPLPLKLAVPVPLPPRPPPIQMRGSAAKPPLPPPKPPAPPPPPKPRPAPPIAAPKEKDEAATLRVSLITTGAGAGFSEIALRRRLGLFALIGLLGIVIDGMIFGGLLYWKSVVEKRNVAAEADVVSIDEKIAARQKELVPINQFQQLVQAESKVLDDHAHWTGVLKLLEETALPDVQFGGLAGAESGMLTFSVSARDYTTLAKQIVAFRHDPRVLKAETGSASAEYGENNLLKGVSADMTLTIDPKVFKYNPVQSPASSSVPAKVPEKAPATAPAPALAPAPPPVPVTVPVP